MKNTYLVIIFIGALLTAKTIFSQGYFIANAGNYISSDKFKTNEQSDISKYEGRYIAASETYESNDEFIITQAGEVLDIKLISGATMDGGDNWMMDTVVFRNVTVTNGKFNLNDISANSGNANFRFVTVTFKQDGKNVYSEGIALEEYKMFAEKEK